MGQPSLAVHPVGSEGLQPSAATLGSSASCAGDPTSHVQPASEGELQNTSRRGLPDPAICVARKSGFGGPEGFVDCLVHEPHQCPHALGFGFGFFCQHPLRDAIVSRSAERAWASGQ